MVSKPPIHWLGMLIPQMSYYMETVEPWHTKPLPFEVVASILILGKLVLITRDGRTALTPPPRKSGQEEEKEEQNRGGACVDQVAIKDQHGRWAS